MNFLFEKFFIILLINFLQAKIIEMIEMMKPNQNFYSQEDSLIFQSNESDFNKITSTNFAFIQKAFQITAFDNGQLLKLFFFNSIQFQNQWAFGICQFFNKNQSYYIVCIDGLQLNHNQTQIQYLKNYKTIKIEITSQNQTVCTDMIIDQNNQIFSYCQNHNNFQIHKINLKNLTSITIQNNDQNILNCSQKFFHFNSSLYLAHYNCENWTIYDVSNNLSIFLNNEILSNLITLDPNVKTQFVNEIFICSKQIANNFQQLQIFIYLIESNKYYLLEKQQNKTILIQLKIFQSKIIKFQIDDNCVINYAVVESENQDIQHIDYYKSTKAISINKKFRENVFVFKQYLLIQKSDKLQLILSQFLSENYEIMPYQIQIIDFIRNKNEKIFNYFPNFLYQINNKEHFIQFYEYQDYPRFIKPTLNYVYLFQGFQLFHDFQDSTQAYITKYTLIYNTPQQIINYKQSNPEKISIQYYCNQIVTFKIQKDLSQYLLEIDQRVFITGNSKIISIEENMAFSRFYKINEESEIKKVIQITNLDLSDKSILVFLSKSNQLIFYQQKQVKQLQFSINQYEVLNIQGFIIIFEQNKNLIISINLINQIYQQTFTLKANIVQYFKCIDSVIFKLANDEIVIFNLISSKFMYSHNQLKALGQPIFYYQNNLFKIIQYDQFLLIQFKSQIYFKFKIENVTIFNVELNYQHCKIKSIHNQKNQLLFYLFDGKSLKQENQFEISNYSLIRPLIYSGNKEYLALAALKDGQKSILVLNIYQYITILKVISCSDFSFTQIDVLLIYNNNQGVLTIFDAKEYLITYKIENNCQNYFDEQKDSIYIEFRSNNQSFTYLQQIDIEIKNACYRLSTLQNIYMMDDNNKINTSLLFYGPSDQVVSSDQNHFQISQSITFSYSISDCDKTNSQFCFINFKISEQLKYDSFQFLFKCLYTSNYLEDTIPLYCFNQNNHQNLFMFNQLNLQNNSIIVSIIQDNTILHINLFKIDIKQKLLLEINSFKLEQNNNFTLFKYDMILENQLVLLKQKQNFAPSFLIYVKENQYKLYDDFQGIQNTFCINQLEDLYLIISDSYDDYLYLTTFQIISFDKFNAKIIYSINLNSELQDYIKQNRIINSKENYFDPYSFNYLKQFYSCIQDGQNIFTCKLFIILNQISCDIQIKINFEQQSFNFELLRLIRNPLNEKRLELYYIDLSVIIITTLDKKSYLYEISRNQSMYDYISLFETLKYQIFQIDTNQYFFVDQKLENFYIGEIGYKINLLNQSNKEKGYLMIKNSISEIQIEVDFKQTNNYKYQQYIIYLLCIFIILIICFYILRRSKLKKIKQQKIIENIY